MKKTFKIEKFRSIAGITSHVLYLSITRDGQTYKFNKPVSVLTPMWEVLKAFRCFKQEISAYL